jgi:hypothetical protein
MSIPEAGAQTSTAFLAAVDEKDKYGFFEPSSAWNTCAR